MFFSLQLLLYALANVTEGANFLPRECALWRNRISPNIGKFQISFIRDERGEVTQMTFQTDFISLRCDRIE